MWHSFACKKKKGVAACGGDIFKCSSSSRCFEIRIEAGSFADLKVQLLWYVWQNQRGLFFQQNSFSGLLHAVVSSPRSRPGSIFGISWEFADLLFCPAFPSGTCLTSVLFCEGNTFFSFSFFLPASIKSYIFIYFLPKKKCL